MSPQHIFLQKVRRELLIQDTLENIVRHEPEDLKKELKVGSAKHSYLVCF